LEKGLDECAGAAFAFGSSDMNDVEVVDIGSLPLSVKL